MTPRVFSLITTTLFSLIALSSTCCAFSAARGRVVPLWVSWIGLAIAGYLAYQGVKLSRPRMK